LAQSYDVLRAETKKYGDIIAAPEDALEVNDFEPAAKNTLPPAHYGYPGHGCGRDLILRANLADYERIHFRVKRLVDARKIDTRLQLFGSESNSPIFLSPIRSVRAFHGEIPKWRSRSAPHGFDLPPLGTNSGRLRS
jgi:4-hydroxymandelate oxidase